MAAKVSHQEIFLGENQTLLLTVVDLVTGKRLDLSVYAAIELEVKGSDGDTGSPLLVKSLANSGIIPRAQTGATLGQADVPILTADTTTSPWPASPANIGTFRYDVIGIDGSGERDVLIAPSNWKVVQVVNTP